MDNQNTIWKWVPSPRIRKGVEKKVLNMLKWREKRANIVGRDFDVWVARMATGGAPRGGVEVLRW
jgi:hypothetical protein